jgi:iron complex transport system permease protein
VVGKIATTGGVRAGLIPVLALLVALLFLGSLAVGPVSLSLWSVARALVGAGEETAIIIVQEIRLPRALLGLLIGGVLGLSGAAMQGLLRNPLAAPSLFGAPQSAAFAAVATISLGLNGPLSWGLPFAALRQFFCCWRLLAAMPVC